MSFSETAKKEMSKSPVSGCLVASAEMYGVMLFANVFTPQEIRITTLSESVARRLPSLLKKAFSLTFDALPEEGKMKKSFSVLSPEKLHKIREVYGCEGEDTFVNHINFGVLESEEEQTAFFRGAFLTAGSVTDPTRGYHLELVTSHFFVSREMPVLLDERGFEAKTGRRGANYLLYFKQSEMIADFLTLVGAPLAAMELMNAKAEKNLLSGINRRVNCDSANLDKAVDAAAAQRSAIRRLEKKMPLDDLPDALSEAAHLRLAHPDMTLSEMGEICSPPVTKSTMSYRMKKLAALAGE